MAWTSPACDAKKHNNAQRKAEQATVNLQGRVVQIAGSCHPDTSRDLLAHAHAIVKALVPRLVAAGARILAGIGDEPFSRTEPSASIIFHWTIIETVSGLIAAGQATPWSAHGAALAVVAPQKADAKIPIARRALWDGLLANGALQLEFLEAGWSAGGVQRAREAALGDVLVVIGGSEGVEHLAQLYAADGKPVIPVDLPIRGSTGTGFQGAARLAAEALAHPEQFVEFEEPATGAAFVAATGTRNGSVPADVVAEKIMRLLAAAARPPAFFVRLLDATAPEFADVEAYFRRVVDPYVAGAGYRPVEMGLTSHRYTWINEAIFKLIQRSSLVVVDLTGVRPNCTLELGFAFGRRKHVLVTASSGTVLPFDIKPFECHMWTDPADPNEPARLRSYAERNAHRLAPP